MEGEVVNVVKYLFLGLFGIVCKVMMYVLELFRSIKEFLIKEMDNEFEELCKKCKNSIFVLNKSWGFCSFLYGKVGLWNWERNFFF